MIGKIKRFFIEHKKGIIIGCCTAAVLTGGVVVAYKFHKGQINLKNQDSRLNMKTVAGGSLQDLLNNGSYEDLARERERQRLLWMNNGCGEFPEEIKIIDKRLDELNIDGIGDRVTEKLLKEIDLNYPKDDSCTCSEALSVDDAADIAASCGFDEELDLGYSNDELSRIIVN